MSACVSEHTEPTLWDSLTGLLSLELWAALPLGNLRLTVVLNQDHTPPPPREEQPAASFLLTSSMKATDYRKRAAGSVEVGVRAFNLGWWWLCVCTNDLIGAGTELCEVIGSHGWPTRTPSPVRPYMFTGHCGDSAASCLSTAFTS